MASEGPRIIGTETEEEKKRREAMEQNSIANSTISKVITKELLNDFLNSDEFMLKIKNDFKGDFGFLPVSNDQEVCNLTYFPSNKGRYKSIIISLLPQETKDKDKGPVGNLLHMQTAGEDEESLTMMIFALGESLKKFNPNSLEIKLTPKNEAARKIMEDACKKYGLKVVGSFSSEKKASAPGATLKMDKPGDSANPRVFGGGR